MNLAALAATIFLAAPAHVVQKPLTLYAHLESDVDDNSVQPIIDTLVRAEDMPSPVRVIIEIDTDGGDIDAGFKLAKAIERSKAQVTCVVDGKAASMGSFILESCDHRVMTKRSFLMIHEAGAETGGHEWDMLDAAERMGTMSRAMFEHYARHIPGLTAATIAARTTGGRCIWLDWREAKKLGAVDAVVDAVTDLR